MSIKSCKDRCFPIENFDLFEGKMELAKVGVGRESTATAPVKVKAEGQRVPAGVRVPNHRKNNSFGDFSRAE